MIFNITSIDINTVDISYEWLDSIESLIENLELFNLSDYNPPGLNIY